jgi:hypothetical protein
MERRFRSVKCWKYMDVLKHNEAPQAQPVEGLRCNFSSRNRFLIVEEGASCNRQILLT